MFLAAGLYNLCWGLFSVVDPQWLFHFAGMPIQNYPEIFACLGMVVGLYGILYLEVARIPERGWLIAAVGLLGKVLGPIGWLNLVWSGQWPIATLILCVTNDLVWWVPFGLYLYDAWPHGHEHDPEEGRIARCRAGGEEAERPSGLGATGRSRPRGR